MDRIEDRAERVAIALPPHALRYLARMLKREREMIAMHDLAAYGQLLNQASAYDSLNEIENAIPKAFRDEGRRS